MSDQHFIDVRDILIATRDAPRDQAMKLRELWRMQLRWLEDVHGLPHSFETRAEKERRIANGGLMKRDDYHEST